MQLKPLQKGRFQQSWVDEYAKIEKIVLACISEKKFVDEGQLVMQQGQQLGSLILVKQGRIALKYSTRSGRNFQLGSIYCDHQIFGEMEFFSNYRCQMDIIASEALEVWIINRDKLQHALNQDPQLALFFASAIAIDYQDTVEILTRRLLYPIAYNIAYDLYHQHLHDQPVDGFTKGYLEAERFGTSDRVYRRSVQQLITLGLIIKQKKKLEIVDMSKLKAYLDAEE
ncbi:Crp/Fnr family transcriptional regulator [Photobacterium kishitanii]|uniref:Crp/Fnr family transcriptional regulator n=1 Tax=Photobacterium kishitanii TaxID=318456 RepID=UPI00043490DC|nr:Crp/Fnr family transcriptional regulator [Photobacterium kishitanii]PSU92801.1 Crp/Fnr family transcriptional regulator [Photobacterium kishitanii]CEO38484.1 putative Cyclic nucleotide binding protein [Photobacterium kishitanii]